MLVIDGSDCFQARRQSCSFFRLDMGMGMKRKKLRLADSAKEIEYLGLEHLMQFYKICHRVQLSI